MVSTAPGVVPAGDGCADPLPERQPFEAVEVDVEQFDDAQTSELDAAEIEALCDALAPAFASDCELFAVGSAIEQDALAQDEFELECAASREKCMQRARTRCVGGLGAGECQATTTDAKLCFEGRANAKGAAVAEIDGLSITCENAIFDLLQAAFRAGALRPAELPASVKDACKPVDACLKLASGEDPTASTKADAGARVGDAGTANVDAGAVSSPLDAALDVEAAATSVFDGAPSVNDAGASPVGDASRTSER